VVQLVWTLKTTSLVSPTPLMAKAKGFLRLTAEEQLSELEDELARGKVYEASLRSTKWVMHGLQQGEDVFVDVRSLILETLWHELIHRRKPQLSERTVDQAAKQLIAHVNESEKQRWWKSYRRNVKKSRPVDVDTVDD
jgi:hypothetical protein